jgi:hypothetical protein
MMQQQLHDIAAALTVVLAMSGGLVAVGLYLLVKRWPR